MQVKWVKDISPVWDIASKQLERSVLISDDESSLEQLKEQVEKDVQRLFVVLEEETILGWLTARITTFPNKKVFTVTHIGGAGVAKQDGFSELQKIAKLCGCSQIQIFCREAQARLWRQKLGFKETYQVLRFDLEKD